MYRTHTIVTLRRLALASTIAGPACVGESGRLGFDVGTDGASAGKATDGEIETSGISASSVTLGTTEGEPLLDLGTLLDVGMGDDPTAMTCAQLEMQTSTSLGCEFFALDRPYVTSGGAVAYGSDFPFGITVGNQASAVAHVVVEDLRGPGGSAREIASIEVQPQRSELIVVNGDGSSYGGPVGILAGEDSAPSLLGFNAAAAFRVRSDVPISAMQISPVGGAPTDFPEASLLLPINALGTEYLVASYDGVAEFASSVVVVATEDATSVTLPDGTVEVLDAFDAWRIQRDDVTGLPISSDRPVAVFTASHAFVPGDWNAADNLEEQMLPLSAWGTRYVGGSAPLKSQNYLDRFGSGHERVFWRILAAVPGTTVRFSSALESVGSEVNLSFSGDYVEFSTDVETMFVAESDDPFLLVQYIPGCDGDLVPPVDSPFSFCGWAELIDEGPGYAYGDPSLSQIVPEGQWMRSLSFLTDGSYELDLLLIARPAGAQVELDCLGVVSDDHFRSIEGTNFEFGRIVLDRDGLGGEGDCVDGVQRLRASEPVGIQVVGAGPYASYAYPGGLQVDTLWDPAG